MKRGKMLLLLPLLGAAIFLMFGCEMPWESDDDDEPVGNSTIQGNVSDFAATASAKAANRAGIVVHLEGPVDRSATTDEDGFFIFSGLPAGTYTIKFTFNGEEVRYRGNSGQEAQITLEENQRAELVGIRISGGTVNIGNLRFVDLSQDSAAGNKSDEDSETSETTTSTSTGGSPAPTTGTVTMTVNVKRAI